MKMAKIFAIMFMLILAVFCFNGPFAFGGDEHPWDEEGGDDGGGLDGTNPAPNPDNNPGKIGSGNAAPEAQSDGSDILTFLKFTVITSVVL